MPPYRALVTRSGEDRGKPNFLKNASRLQPGTGKGPQRHCQPKQLRNNPRGCFNAPRSHPPSCPPMPFRTHYFVILSALHVILSAAKNLPPFAHQPPDPTTGDPSALLRVTCEGAKCDSRPRRPRPRSGTSATYTIPPTSRTHSPAPNRHPAEYHELTLAALRKHGDFVAGAFGDEDAVAIVEWICGASSNSYRVAGWESYPVLGKLSTELAVDDTRVRISG